jgi:hypothetical protein
MHLFQNITSGVGSNFYSFLLVLCFVEMLHNNLENRDLKRVFVEGLGQICLHIPESEHERQNNGAVEIENFEASPDSV